VKVGGVLVLTQFKKGRLKKEENKEKKKKPRGSGGKTKKRKKLKKRKPYKKEERENDLRLPCGIYKIVRKTLERVTK